MDNWEFSTGSVVPVGSSPGYLCALRRTSFAGVVALFKRSFRGSSLWLSARGLRVMCSR
jgi:hypothetical protein